MLLLASRGIGAQCTSNRSSDCWASRHNHISCDDLEKQLAHNRKTELSPTDCLPYYDTRTHCDLLACLMMDAHDTLILDVVNGVQE